MSDKIRNKTGDTVGSPWRQRIKLKGALKNVFSPKLGVMLKILSSEYQLYACGKIYHMP
jgi:hypothetical protein